MLLMLLLPPKPLARVTTAKAFATPSPSMAVASTSREDSEEPEEGSSPLAAAEAGSLVASHALPLASASRTFSGGAAELAAAASATTTNPRGVAAVAGSGGSGGRGRLKLCEEGEEATEEPLFSSLLHPQTTPSLSPTRMLSTPTPLRCSVDGISTQLPERPSYAQPW